MKTFVLAGATLALAAATPAFAQTGGESAGAAPPLTRAVVQQRLQAGFDSHDANHDGFLTADELGDNAAEAIAALDADHDGKVSPSELSSRTLAVFDAVDANHDGTLSGDEQEAASERMSAPAGGDEAQPEASQPQPEAQPHGH
jgi:hypothetical protein